MKIDENIETGKALFELRLLTGLTHQQIANIFGVHKQTLLFWCSGRAMDPQTEAHLQELLTVIRETDRGAADLNYSMLLSDCAGSSPLSLLIEGKFEEFRVLVGEGVGRRKIELTPLSKEARDARRPLPPEFLMMGSLPHAHVSTRGRGAKTVRNIKKNIKSSNNQT